MDGYIERQHVALKYLTEHSLIEGNHFVPEHHTSSDTDTNGEGEGNRFYLKINGVVSNGNADERVYNHEYHQFCVHMKCIEGLNIHGNNRVIERQGENIVNDEFYVQNNHELPIDAPEFCNLDLSITFHVTHIVNGYCFADGGADKPSNYDDWVCLYLYRVSHPNPDKNLNFRTPLIRTCLYWCH